MDWARDSTRDNRASRAQSRRYAGPSLSPAGRVKVSLDVKASVDVPHYRTRCHFWQIDLRLFFVRSSASREPTAVDDDRETTPNQPLQVEIGFTSDRSMRFD